MAKRVRTRNKHLSKEQKNGVGGAGTQRRVVGAGEEGGDNSELEEASGSDKEGSAHMTAQSPEATQGRGAGSQELRNGRQGGAEA